MECTVLTIYKFQLNIIRYPFYRGWTEENLCKSWFSHGNYNVSCCWDQTWILHTAPHTRKGLGVSTASATLIVRIYNIIKANMEILLLDLNKGKSLSTILVLAYLNDPFSKQKCWFCWNILCAVFNAWQGKKIKTKVCINILEVGM